MYLWQLSPRTLNPTTSYEIDQTQIPLTAAGAMWGNYRRQRSEIQSLAVAWCQGGTIFFFFILVTGP